MKTGWPDKFYVKKVNIRNDANLSKGKAMKMLHEGMANDEPLTKKQRGLFGAIASGKARKKGY